jgi:TATA-box binding protein (TBP) (component of TFIID and TFIIIB)
MIPIKPIIQNIVSTLSLALPNGEKFNLHTIVSKLPNAHYRPERFSALIIRMPQPIRTTALFFSTGRLVCVGTKSNKNPFPSLTNLWN